MNSRLRSALRSGAPVFGSWIQFGHTAIAELLAQAGFDWLGIDLQHSAIGLESVLPLVQVIELSGCAPLIRLPANDPVMAQRVMDLGAHGVIVPSVNSPEEAARAVQSVKYPPAGTRSVGLGRAHGYGPGFRNYLTELEDGALVIAMIEHREGLDRVDEICRVPGVDGVFVGPYDLSASYGIAGEFEHALMREAFAKILEATRSAGIAAGIHVVHPPVDQVQRRLTEGFRFIAYAGDMLFLVPAARESVLQLRQLACPYSV